MSEKDNKYYKIVNKKKPSGWSAGYRPDSEPDDFFDGIDFSDDIGQVISEALVQEGKLKEAVWYLIQFQLAILDYHETGSKEDMRKAKLYGEHLIGRLLK